MDIDAKQKVLYALYTEYQKDIPDMTQITHKVLDMEEAVFKIALVKLENEGFIKGLIVPRIDQQQGFEPVLVNWDSVKMTRTGIEYVENKLDIEQSKSSIEKLKWLRDKFGEFGWEALKAYAISKLTGI